MYVTPLLPEGPDFSLHTLLRQPSCGRADAGGGTGAEGNLGALLQTEAAKNRPE